MVERGDRVEGGERRGEKEEEWRWREKVEREGRTNEDGRR